MKIVRQTRLLAVAAGALALGLSSSLMAMPFCGDKGYPKRTYHDPYAYTYIPGHGGYVPYVHGYHMPRYHHPHAMAYVHGHGASGYHGTGNDKGGAETQEQDSTSDSSSGY